MPFKTLALRLSGIDQIIMHEMTMIYGIYYEYYYCHHYYHYYIDIYIIIVGLPVCMMWRAGRLNPGVMRASPTGQRAPVIHHTFF